MCFVFFFFVFVCFVLFCLFFCCCFFFFVFFFFFFKNSGFIVSNYRKSLNIAWIKCERLCIGVSAFNLARDFWWSHGEVTSVGSLGTSHFYTWAYDVVGNPVTY